MNLEGTDVEFSLDDLLISSSSAEGFVAESDNGITVVLDTNLTPALIMEGVERELISKIQTMRKEADFNVTDHIAVSIHGSDKLVQLAAAHADEILGDVLGDRMADTLDGYTKEWDINGEQAVITVARV